MKTKTKYMYYLSVIGLFCFILSPFGNFIARAMVIFITLIILLLGCMILDRQNRIISVLMLSLFMCSSNHIINHDPIIQEERKEMCKRQDSEEMSKCIETKLIDIKFKDIVVVIVFILSAELIRQKRNKS
ncbi:hypothetical protein IU825_004521 [Salmonella enterica]|uniref:hypothetical protein n=1 Tax=Klebsiella pneumoniae TaxID=573 RepID=UPI000C7C2BAF|nr:hypothetical protein [Klebsiella pneumoniae]EGI2001381.1 hypothetical protein [Salmonella enterica]EGO7257721.1 hypothetical protein [Salmonella enterica]EIY1159680.1 hypothetical protein [Enterobacter hormaechei]PLH28521.1 hypothetical protein B6J26_20625 [Klebsiella pneumoniae]